MVIKIIGTSALNPVVKSSAKKIPSKFVPLSSSGVFFVKSKTTHLEIENEIAQLKLKLQEHKKIYNSLSKKLDFSFGDDWVFCYPDLNDVQSDMYIECIAQKSLMALCEKKIAQLTQKISSYIA